MKNYVQFDTSGFEQMIRKLEEVGGDVKGAVEEALRYADEKILSDTEAALSAAHLPAGGTYSTGDTREAIVSREPATWEHDEAWVPVGFDFSKKGAGGWLISGTPKMTPDKELNRMYKGKRYMQDVEKTMSEMVLGQIVRAMER